MSKRRWGQERETRPGAGRVAGVLGAVAVLALAMTAHGAAAQGSDPAEAVMIAAGEWVGDRVPGGVARVDPHRSGAGVDGDRLERVARTLGASLERLENVRECPDVMDPASCSFDGGPIVAIAVPRIDGQEASVKVYAWYRSEDRRQPVAQRSWTLTLRQAQGEWRVVSQMDTAG